MAPVAVVKGNGMAILPIRQYGEPVLHERAAPVGHVDRDVRQVMQDLWETMEDAPGIGLAAPQVGVSLRVIVVHVEDESHLIANPRIIAAHGSQEGVEACLSLPGVQGVVVRPQHVVVGGANRNGRSVKIEAEDLLARCLCHEIDHLDGCLFLDKALDGTICRSICVGEDEDGDPIYRHEPLTREEAFEWLLAQWHDAVATSAAVD